MTSAWLDIYIGFGQIAGAHQQRHWALVLVPQGQTTHCSFFHITGGPIEYTHCTQGGQFLHEHPLAFMAPIGSIPSYLQKGIIQITRRVPPQRCQRYIVEVLEELEYQGLVALGYARYFGAMVGESMWEVANRTPFGEEDVIGCDGGGDSHEEGEGPVAAAEFVQLGDMARLLGWSPLDYCTCFF